MASLVKSGSHFYVAYRYNGKRFLRSLKASNEGEAKQHLATVRSALKAILDGHAVAPTDADDFWAFLRSGGKRVEKHILRYDKTLAAIVAEYIDTCPVGAKEENSIATERTQLSKFRRIIGAETPLAKIDVVGIESYIRQRQGEKGSRGRKASPVTIKKELVTFSQVWKFARNCGYVTAANPVDAARKPKPDAAMPFQTWGQIEKSIRPKMSDHEKALRWSCLFLDEQQITELLDHAKSPAIAFVAYSGCRRSEMMRSTVGDLDFRSGSIRIREKKKSQRLNTTYRTVQMHPKLAAILKAYLKNHDGGQLLFPDDNGQPLTGKRCDSLFKRAVAGSKWECVEGFHVLRHSFISLCAMRGISQAIIDSWVGHTTAQMRERYRHLFPVELEQAMERLFV